jgi:3-methyladenine DNA glycosylase AlkC
MAITAEPTFSLKDQLFNKTKVQMIAEEILVVYPEFQTKQFIVTVTKKFPDLELLERLYWIRDCLHNYLPDDYRTAVQILVDSFPAPCDPNLSDDDYGDFIYGPYGAFVAAYGCSKKNLSFSLQTLKEMTKRFSVEFPIRSFINAFPEETMLFLLRCASEKNYHVRRLASEGTRSKLPWAKNITISYKEPLQILDVLFSDETRYVTRSVANHMNDISKVDPELVVKTLKRWQKSGDQLNREMGFIIKHSLRTLEKQGHAAALGLLGYKNGEVQVQKVQISTPTVVVGEWLEFSFSVTSTSTKSQNLLIDYHLYFQKASGELAPKTFKITKTSIEPGATLTFTKRQLLRPMTTRVLHAGRHEVELQINGTTYPRKNFVLVSS